MAWKRCFSLHCTLYYIEHLSQSNLVNWMHIENDLNASWIVVQRNILHTYHILNEIFSRGQSVIFVLARLELLEVSDSLLKSKYSNIPLSLICNTIIVVVVLLWRRFFDVHSSIALVDDLNSNFDWSKDIHNYVPRITLNQAK